MINNYTEELRGLEKSYNLRKLPGEVPPGLINLSSNDYLGIVDDNEIYDEFLENEGEKRLRFSSASSRLLTGDSKEYGALEKSISSTYGREACLIFNSGYHLNIGILPAIAGKGDLVVADKLVHASIIDGLQLCKAEVMRYRHLDYSHLEMMLLNADGKYRNIFIVSESVFSMDGDMADLCRLIELKKRYNTFLYIDEAHAVGVRGEYGLGCAEEFKCIEECDFIVGTFGKALASLGAFVVCDGIFKQYLVNNSRSLIFTTALPSINLKWTDFIFSKLPYFSERRAELAYLSKWFAQKINVKAETHIVPYACGSNESALMLSVKLKDAGYYVLPIRYPAVPKGKARLRFSLNAGINKAGLKGVVELLLKN